MSKPRPRTPAGEVGAAASRAAKPRAKKAAPPAAKKGGSAAASQTAQPVRAAHATQAQNAALRELVERLGAQLATGLDVEAMLRTVAECLTDTAAAGHCDVYMLENGILRCVASRVPGGYDSGYEGTALRLKDYPATAHSVAELKPFLVESPDDSRLVDRELEDFLRYGYRSELCVPLVVQGQVVGLIDLFSEEDNAFAECQPYVRDIGSLVATTLANTLLLEQLKGANRDLRLLATAGLEFSSSLDLERVLDSVARALCLAANAASCDIYALEDHVIRALTSADGDVIDQAYRGTTWVMYDGHFVQQVVATRELFEVTDVLIDDRVPEVERDEWAQFGHRSGIGLPLLADGRVQGVAFIFDERPRSFDGLDLLQGLARIAAQAMANAELFRSLEMQSRENALLAEIARHTTASVNVGQIARATLAQLKDLVEFDGAGVVLGAVGEVPEVAYAWQSEGPVDLARFDDRIHEFWTRLEREQIVVLDLPADLPAGVSADVTEGMRSALGIGLKLNDRLIGVLALVSHGERAYDTVDRELLGRIAGHLTLAINNTHLCEDIQRMHVGNLKALSSALSAKDYYTLGHAARVSAYTLLLGWELGWPAEVAGQIEEAAYLHDIGKIGISDRVLLKPSGLNPHEWELMRHHPIFSADIIRPLFNDELVAGVRHHHERWDGRGYPDGLKGDGIPFVARAMAVVDAYDAMSFRRPYRNARTYSECLAELKRCRGGQFDPAMVDAFGRVLRRLERRRATAIKAAEKAARTLDLSKHSLLVGPADEARPEYRQIADMLRTVRDANPPTRYLQTMAHVDGRFVMVVDSDDDPATHMSLGDEIYADQELPEAFAGMRVDCNTLVVDQFGAWVSGRVPVLGPDGNVVAVVAADLPPVDEMDLEGLHSDVIESFAGLVKKTVAQGARAELEAITDGLTGQYNVRYLQERLAEEVDRARESGAPLALVLCDVDNFREFNEKHGYDAGDRALRTIALIVEESLRGVDLAARYGGDEFAAILIGTDAEGAWEVAERIRNSIGEAHFTTARETLTASVGYACFPTDADGREQLIDKAEWARRRAKRRGRDIVVGFSEPGSGGRPRRR